MHSKNKRRIFVALSIFSLLTTKTHTSSGDSSAVPHFLLYVVKHFFNSDVICNLYQIMKMKKLNFEPARPKPEVLGDDLMNILILRYDLKVGTFRLTKKHIDYLQGLADAGVRDANKLIEAIKTHEAIDIFLST